MAQVRKQDGVVYTHACFFDSSSGFSKKKQCLGHPWIHKAKDSCTDGAFLLQTKCNKCKKCNLV